MPQTNKLKNEINVEIADILKAHIVDYQDQYPLYPEQHKIVFDILNCRTAYLGGHVDRCVECGKEQISYNSCRNRHCPKCQSLPREKWLEGRKADLLPVKYFHNVFTLIGVSATVTKEIEKSVQEIMLELTGVDIFLCPCCKKGKMTQVREIATYTGQSAYEIIRPPNMRSTA